MTPPSADPSVATGEQGAMEEKTGCGDVDGVNTGGRVEQKFLGRRYSAEWCGVRAVVFDEDEGDGKEADERSGAREEAPRTSENWLRFANSPPETTPPPFSIVKSWDFDVLRYAEPALIPVVCQIFEHYDLLSTYSIELSTMTNYVRAVMVNHDDHLYHNWYHAVATTLVSFLILTLGGADEFLLKRDVFAILFGALIHDVDHAGHNNDFEVKTETDRAIKYEGKSVLERHSIDVGFDLTEGGVGEDRNIFRNMTKEDVEYIKGVAFEAILSTDAALHSNLTKELLAVAERVDPTASEEAQGDDPATAAPFRADDDQSRLLLARAIVHAADISNPVHPSPDVAMDWCARITAEFKRQVDNERRLNLEVTGFMDGLDTAVDVAKLQIGFHNFMVHPLFKVLGVLLPKLAPLELNGIEQVKRYKEMAESGKC